MLARVENTGHACADGEGVEESEGRGRAGRRVPLSSA